MRRFLHRASYLASALGVRSRGAPALPARDERADLGTRDATPSADVYAVLRARTGALAREDGRATFSSAWLEGVRQDAALAFRNMQSVARGRRHRPFGNHRC